MREIEGFNLKTKMEEFTILEFETISSIMNDENKDNIEKYLNILEYLGTPDDILNEMTTDTFYDIIKEMNSDVECDKTLLPQITIDKYTYDAYTGDEFKLKIKDLSKIESRILAKPNEYVLYAIAVIFKRTDLTKTEHYTEAHIEYKMKLFKELPVIDIYPYIVYIQENVSKKLLLMSDDNK